MTSSRYADVLLRIALAVAFLYPPIAVWTGYSDVYSWIGYFPGFTKDIPLDSTALLMNFEIFEVIIALWILFAKRPYVPSVIAAAILLGIVVFNLPQMDVLFRDISILIAALALAMLHWPKRA